MDALQKIPISAICNGSQNSLFLAIERQHHNCSVWKSSADHPTSLYSVNVRHLHIQEHKIGSVLSAKLYSSFTAIRITDYREFIPSSEQFDQTFPIQRLIVNDHYPCSF